MKRLGKVFLATGVVAMAASACFSDPTSDLRNGPSRLNLSRRFVVQNVGDTDQVNVSVLDDQGNALSFEAVSYAPVDPTVATMADLPDSTLRTFPGNTLFKTILIGLGAGTTKIAITAGGVTDSLTVLVFPVAFTGTITPASGNMGDTITVTAPAGITFDTTVANVTLNGGPVLRTGRTTTTIKFLAPDVTGGTITVTGGLLLGQYALPALTSTATLTVANQANEPANDNMLAPGTLAATTSFQTLFGSLSSSDANDFFRIDLAAPGIIEAFLDFTGTGAGNAGNPDIDVYVVRDVNGNGIINAADICNEFGGTFLEADCTGATSANPEHEITKTLPAGTYYINVELFNDGGFTQTLPYKLRYRIQ